MATKLTIFQRNFFQRVSHKNSLLASGWLFAYSSLLTLAIAALFIFTFYCFNPESVEVLNSSSSQKNPKWLMSIVFNPLLESLILIFCIKLSSKAKLGRFSIVISALIVAALHSIQNIYWGVTVLSFFLVQATAYFYLFMTDFSKGYVILSASHSIHNAWVFTSLSYL